MHNLILKLLEFIKQFIYFMQILCIFLIGMMTLYWIQSIISANWTWLNFIKPVLDSILSLSENISSSVWDCFGIQLEVKYIIGIIILAVLTIFFRYLYEKNDNLRNLYNNIHIDCIKINEKIVNKNLYNSSKKKELKLNKYTVYIKTKIKKDYLNLPDTDLADQNKQMNDFIYSKTKANPSNFKDGFLYEFENFSDIDDVLSVMFKVLRAKSRLDYYICIQIGNDLEQISKLSDLSYYGKIVMCADTKYRYQFNEIKNYLTETVGEYQKEDGILQVHEFKEKE